MRPLSSLYDRLLEARARRFADGRSASEKLALPTLSVGNLTVGGTGKTPFVIHLAERFLSQGRRPAILSRGYGRRSTAVVVVSAGDGPLVGPDEGGDEPVLLASRLPGAVVVVAPRRSDAARAALGCSPDLFILDDGFQHLSVGRDLDLVLLDSRDPFGGGRYPPLGRLREPPSALARAGAVVFTRAGAGHPSPEVRRDVARRNPSVPQFTAVIRPDRLVAADGSKAPPPVRPLAVSGIARPEEFLRTLDSMGLVPTETLAFEDHRRYGSPDVDRIARAAAASGADSVVTTEKDLVKLAGRLSLPLFAVRLAVEVEEPGFATFVSERLFGRHLGARR